MKETEQTLLEKIKDEVAISHGYVNWNEIEDDHLEDVENKLWPIVCERFATAKAKASCEATLKKASENATLMSYDHYIGIDKSSINNPSNIVIV